MVTIYNDGHIAVQLLELECGAVNVGTIDGRLHGASSEEFLADLPVNKAFMDEMRENDETWQSVQEAIDEGLASRGVTRKPQ